MLKYASTETQITNNGFILKQNRFENYNVVEETDTNSLDGSLEVIRSYVVYPEIEDMLTRYKNGELDYKDFYTVVELSSIFYKMFPAGINVWVKNQYVYGAVGTVKDMFLRDLFDYINGSKRDFNPALYSGVSQPGSLHDHGYVDQYPLLQWTDAVLAGRNYFDNISPISPKLYIDKLVAVIKIIAA